MLHIASNAENVTTLGLAPPEQLLTVTRTPREIINAQLAALAESYGTTLAEMKSPSRRRKDSRPRQAAMAYLRDLGWTYPQIGRYFGRDHSTAVVSVRVFAERLACQ